jgi:hypothetical protein
MQICFEKQDADGVLINSSNQQLVSLTGLRSWIFLVLISSFLLALVTSSGHPDNI